MWSQKNLNHNWTWKYYLNQVQKQVDITWYFLIDERKFHFLTNRTHFKCEESDFANSEIYAITCCFAWY